MSPNPARFTALCAMPLLLVLAGCSPHPAAGVWAAAADNGFNRLEVTYEGRALLYTAGEDKAGRHCFWGGESAQAIALTCKPAFNTELEERYRLTLDADGTARLMQDDQVMAHLLRQK